MQHSGISEQMSDTSNKNVIDEEVTDVPQAVCEALVKVLKEGVDVQRCAAAKALGSLKHNDSVQPLIEALLDEDPDVRADVAEALSRIKDPSASEQLLANFIDDPDTDVKRYALRALVDMRYAPTQEWLEKLLREEEDEIQWDLVDFFDREWDDREDFRLLAVEGLGIFKGTDAIKDITAVLDDEFAQDMTEVAFRTLINIGGQGIATVGKYLVEGDDRQRRRAAAALAASAAPDAEALTTVALQDKSLEVRLFAARALAARSSDDPRLRLILADTNAQARAEAIHLCGANNPEWIARLIDDKHSAVQIAALEVLAKNPDICSGMAVIEAVRERIVGKKDAPSPDGVVTAALKAYAAIGAKDALEHLTAIAEDTSRVEEVRLAAVEGLAIVGGEAATIALTQLAADSLRHVRLNSLAALVGIAERKDSADENATKALFAALHGELVSPEEPEPAETETEEASDDPVAEETVDASAEDVAPDAALEDADGERVVEDDAPAEIGLVEELDDVEPDVGPMSTLDAVIAANEQVEVFKGGEEVELNADDLEMLENVKIGGGRNRGRIHVPHPYDDVRRFAARVMGDLRRDDAAVELASCLRDPDQDLAVTAADSIARIAHRGTPLPYETVQALIFAFRTGERDLRMQALRGLANDTGGKGPGLLADGLKDEDAFVRIEALRGLGNRRCAGQEVTDMLSVDHGEVRLCAARAIANTQAPDVLDTLANYAFAFEAVHRRQAAGMMKDIDADGASVRMINIIGDEKSSRLWQAAAEVLHTLHNEDVEVNV